MKEILYQQTTELLCYVKCTGTIASYFQLYLAYTYITYLCMTSRGQCLAAPLTSETRAMPVFTQGSHLLSCK